MGRLVTASNMLAVLEDALLPSLLLELEYDPVLLEALSTYAHKLGTRALAVGGGFRVRARRLSSQLLAYVRDAKAQPPVMSDLDLRECADRLTGEVHALQYERVTDDPWLGNGAVTYQSALGFVLSELICVVVR
ncbi:hypothetical protein BS78_07G016400 [Paspalum vaginatum]|nr:hypothetical protein BS78_07G016400 [Paspalum vaginatum]